MWRRNCSAISRRLIGMVNAVAPFFPTQRFLCQKPARKQTQCHKMMPAVPRLNFVIRQAAFTFRTSETILLTLRELDAMADGKQREAWRRHHVHRADCDP